MSRVPLPRVAWSEGYCKSNKATFLMLQNRLAALEDEIAKHYAAVIES